MNNSSIHIYMNPLMKTMLQGKPAKLCAKEQLCHNESLIFKRLTRGGLGLLDCWHFFFIQFCIQAKGRQLAMSLQAAAQHRVWCSLADPKICTVPSHHQLKLIDQLMFSSFGHARNPSQNTRYQTQHLTPNPFEHPVLGFQMASTCNAERSLPEMAGYASQMPKQNDGSLHSSSRLVRKDTCSAVGY